MNEKRNRGQVLVLVALAMFVLLGLAALGIDVGFMYSVRHELQRSADAGALAGASAFVDGDWNDPGVQSIADSRARAYASKDPVAQTQLNPASEVAVSFPLQDRIEVITSRNANLFFARIFGPAWVNKLITARAVAWAAPTDCSGCVKPWAIPWPWVDNNTNNGLFDPAETDTVKPFCANIGDTNCWPAGTQRTLKVGQPTFNSATDSYQSTSGQFFIIDGNVGNTYQGANIMSDFISGDNCMKLDLNENISLLPGGKMGPTQKPVEDLILSGDPWNGPPDPLPTRTGNRLVYVVVYDPRISMVDGGGAGDAHGTHGAIPGNEPGTQTVGFAGFYLDKYESIHGPGGNNDWVTGRFTGIMLNGTGGCGSPGLAKHVALVE